MKKILLFAFVLISFLGVQAKEVKFTASAPNAVALNQPFKLIFSINTKTSSFQAPDLTNFEILAGPSESHSSSVTWVNRKMEQTANYSFTYVLRAKKVGKFTIGEAVAKVKKETYNSNSISIEVVKVDSEPTNVNNTTKQPSTINGNGNDLYIKLIPDRKTLYQGEHLIVSVNLYTMVDIAGNYGLKKPNYKGFYKQIIEAPTSLQGQQKVIDGKIYHVALIEKLILYPQRAGKLEIDPYKFEVAIRKRVKSQSVFDDFFGGYTTVKRMLETKPVSIKVKALPSPKPESFSGSVGKFNIRATVDKTQVKENEAITYKIVISGNGNLKLLESPVVNFPPDFETYDPKIDEKIKNTISGARGDKAFEYLIIPRHNGDFEIEPVTFSYFDPKSKSYKTLTTESFKINVAKDENAGTTTTTVSGISKEEVKFLGQDIRYIKTNVTDFKSIGKVMFGSWTFILIIVLTILAFVGNLVYFIHRKKTRQNIVLVKYKKANKVAKKRLKSAEEFLNSNNSEKFYEEILKALWGYLSDKLNIPLAELSMDNAMEILRKREVETAIIKQFSSIITTCEYARYAPIEGETQLDTDYRKAMDVLSNFEQKLK